MVAKSQYRTLTGAIRSFRVLTGRMGGKWWEWNPFRSGDGRAEWHRSNEYLNWILDIPVSLPCPLSFIEFKAPW